MQFYKFHYVKVIDKAMKYYAVSVGRKVGIYNTWKECQQQVKSFSGAKYKKFSTLHDAQKFIDTVKQEGQGNKKQMTDVFKYTNNITKKELNIRKRKSFESIASYSKTMKIGDDKAKSSGFEQCPVVYTDGACSSNGKKGSSAGYGVWWGENHPLNLSCKLDGIQTNQRAEIAAVSAAIKQAKGSNYNKIVIKTDSKFVIDCLTKWAPAWKRNNWLKSDGKPVVHKAEFLAILEDMKTVKVRFDHVLGHKGVYGNEKADQLAVAGAKL